MTGAARTDADLTVAALGGDGAAFECLVRRHQASVRALARRLTGSVSDGDDIAQAAFLIAWRRRSTWRGGSFRGWVCSIAYREFLRIRRAARVTQLADAPGPDDRPGERIDLLRAFAALDEKERSAVALCLGAGLSHSEAALAMGQPLGSVKSWVSRGRAKLQSTLAAYAKA